MFRCEDSEQDFFLTKMIFYNLTSVARVIHIAVYLYRPSGPACFLGMMKSTNELCEEPPCVTRIRPQPSRPARRRMKGKRTARKRCITLPQRRPNEAGRREAVPLPHQRGRRRRSGAREVRVPVPQRKLRKRFKANCHFLSDQRAWVFCVCLKVSLN